MNNNSLSTYKEYQERQKTKLKIANLNHILNQLEKAPIILKKQKKKSLLISLITFIITTLFFNTLIVLYSNISLQIIISNIIMSIILSIVTKTIYYKETTKEIRKIIKNNNPNNIKQEIANLKSNNKIVKTTFTKINPSKINNNNEKTKVYQLQRK